MSLTALKNHIIFTFLDPVNSKGEFERKQTSFGLELLPGFDNSAKQPRWGRVMSVGPEVKDVQIGQEILLPPLRWTERVTHQGNRFWKTHETEVVCVRDAGRDSDLKVLNNFILFQPKAAQVNQTESGLFFVGSVSDDNAQGTITTTGPGVTEELKAGITFVYDGNSFYDNVEAEWVSQGFSFIKEDNVLCYFEE